MRLREWLSVLVLSYGTSVFAEARITVVNGDPPGVGLNDPTPAEPVGGNPGTTVGEQRLNVARKAAAFWNEHLDSRVEIRAHFSYHSLGSCNIFGQFDVANFAMDFPGAIYPGTWYPSSLANALARHNLFPGQDDMTLADNSDYDGVTCPTELYYGYDGRHGAKFDMLAANLRQIAHGLGFFNLVDGSTGELYQGSPDIFTQFIYDDTAQMSWAVMTDQQRKDSARNFRNVVWSGTQVTRVAGSFLQQGMPAVLVHSPPELPPIIEVIKALFGPLPTSPGVEGEVVFAGIACQSIDGVEGKVALIDRGTCNFTDKVRNAQNAGAIGVIIANSVAGTPAGVGGIAPDITIPTLSISMADGNAIKVLLNRPDTRVDVELGLDLSRLAGADSEGHLLLYTPVPVPAGAGGTADLWDPNAIPSLLLSPSLPSDLPRLPDTVDLTPQALYDLGWPAARSHCHHRERGEVERCERECREDGRQQLQRCERQCHGRERCERECREQERRESERCERECHEDERDEHECRER